MPGPRHFELIERLQQESAQPPSRYRLKLIGLCALGFAGLLMPLALAVLCLGITWLRLQEQGMDALLDGWAILILLTGLISLRAALWQLPQPLGHLLGQDEAPELSREIERLRVAAGAPRLAGVIVTDEPTCTMASLPRMLGFPRSRHFLVLGLPLMQQLEFDALRALIAHEFDHFDSGRDRLAAWVYRLRQTWNHVHSALELGPGIWALPVLAFLDWYAPYFEAYSFVLAREVEASADRRALELVGARPLLEALVLGSLVKDRDANGFEASLLELTRRRAEPPSDYFLEYRRQLTPQPGDSARLARLLRTPAGLDDTHPSLAERITAIGQPLPLQLPPSVRRPASDLLGPLEGRLMRSWSEEWVIYCAEDWRADYERASAERGRLEALSHKATGGEGLDDAEFAEHARLYCLEYGAAQHTDLLEEALARSPLDAGLHLLLGRALQEREDPRCVEHLQAAGRLDQKLCFETLPLLESFHQLHGDAASLRRVHEACEQFDQARCSDARARSPLRLGDRLLPHGLDDSQQQRLLETLQGEKLLLRAWLVRKQLPAQLGPPHFVLVVDWRRLLLMHERALDRLKAKLELPGTFGLYDYERMPAGPAQVVLKVAAEPFYRST